MIYVAHKSYGEFSGPAIAGKIKYQLPSSNNHWDRVLYLTTQVESGGLFGSVMAYDGTGMTAGLTQSIAVYPRALTNSSVIDDQGELWKLLWEIKTKLPTLKEWDELDDAFLAKNWELINGVLYWTNNKDLVNGNIIRNTFTPPNGKVPITGVIWNQSKEWAVKFHNLFSRECTFDIQIKFGQNRFIDVSNLDNCKIKNIVYRGFIPENVFSHPILGPHIDLAMCIFWSYFVNAPAVAKKKLNESLTTYEPKDKLSGLYFSKILIKKLCTSTYGRWATMRFKRTRSAAIKMDAWPEDFFDGPDAIMPSSF